MKSKKAIIVTLGFDEKFCYRTLLRHGFREEDILIVFTASEDERVMKAFQTIQHLVCTSFKENARIILKAVDICNFPQALKEVRKTLKEHIDGRKVVANLSGGMRALCMVVLFALMLEEIEEIHVEVELEDFSGVIEVPASLVRILDLLKRLNEDKTRTLLLISKGYSTVRELATALEKDDTTIRRYVAELEELGLIKKEKRKPMKFKITEHGKALLDP